MLRIIFNDLTGKNTAPNEILIGKLSQRDKLLYSFIHNLDSDKEGMK